MTTHIEKLRRATVLISLSLGAIAIIAAVAWFGFRVASHKSARTELERGDQYAEQKDWHTAIACYGKAIQLNPTLTRAYLQRGRAYENIWPMDFERAITDYNKAIELEANNAEAFYYRGCVYYQTIQPKNGVSDLTEAIRLKSDYAEAYRYRGAMMFSLGDTIRAIDDSSQAIRLAPNDDKNWYYRSMLHEKNGNVAGAISDASKAIEIDANRDNYWRRAEARAASDEPELAVQDYTSALDLDPSNNRILRDRAAAKRASGDMAGAEQDEALATLGEAKQQRTNDLIISDQKSAEFNELLQRRSSNRDDK